MKRTLLLLTGLFVTLPVLAQKPQSTTTTFQGERRKVSTQNFYPTEVLKAPEITFLLGDGKIAAVTTSGVTVRACIKTNKSLTQLSLFVNNVKTADRELNVQPDDGQSDCNQSVSQTVSLREGENKIRLTAQNPAGTTMATLLIRYRKVETVAVTTEKRLALVIGNADYPGISRLTNPVNDANDMAAALGKLGFEVILHTNVTKRQMAAAVNDFGERLQVDYQVGMFYYAGHGLQHNNTNFLMPIDAEPRSAGDIEYTCEFADRVLAKMREARVRTNIVVLDACRNNPFERRWSRGDEPKGLSAINGPNGSFIAYATAPGQTAADGTTRNGLYTAALLKYLRVPDLSIENVFKQVRLEVMKQSNNRQVPWDSSSMTGDFYFSRK